jgi:5-methylcytosine-specific restriction endonuclease McrA
MTENIVPHKRCTGCKEEKPLGDFYKNRARKDGLNDYCKVCWNARIRKVIDSGKHAEYSQRSHERIRNDPARWAAALATQRRRRLTYIDPNPAKRRAKQREHYRANRDQYFANVSARKTRLLGGGGRHTADEWQQMRELFGNVCVCCGRRIRLTRDHVVPTARGGSDDILNIQPLCLGCNKQKFTEELDFRTWDKVCLIELNEVGRRLFPTLT